MDVLTLAVAKAYKNTVAPGASTAAMDLSGKQDLLISGTNIKTINGQSLIGAGNINITGGSGTLDDIRVDDMSIVTSGIANLSTITISEIQQIINDVFV